MPAPLSPPIAWSELLQNTSVLKIHQALSKAQLILPILLFIALLFLPTLP